MLWDKQLELVRQTQKLPTLLEALLTPTGLTILQIKLYVLVSEDEISSHLYTS